MSNQNLTNMINNLSAEQSEVLLEVMESLSLAKTYNRTFTTTVGQKMSSDFQKTALQTAQELFNNLKLSFIEADESAAPTSVPIHAPVHPSKASTRLPAPNAAEVPLGSIAPEKTQQRTE